MYPRADGSPPRAWGIRFVLVENTPGLRVHPHVRGEYVYLTIALTCLCGSPPRAWGIRTVAHSISRPARVMTSDQLPSLSLDRLKTVLGDMVQQGLLDLRGLVYQPASAGWEFIESSRIYSNIDPSPAEVSLVDADSGKIVATVAGVSNKYVRIAGKSYELLPGGKPGEARIRGAGGEAGSPHYHAVKLPFSTDLGLSVAGRFGLPIDKLAVITLAGGVVVMTWLGKLLNATLAEHLKSIGRIVKAKGFALVLEGTAATEVLALLQSAVAAVVQKNPLGEMAVEQMVDVGPHFVELSTAMKILARQDWLDQTFLSRWSDSMRGIELIDPETDLGQDLVRLP